VIRDQDADPGCDELPEDLLNLGDCNRIDAGKGFIV
jgi:hypothetical protein